MRNERPALIGGPLAELREFMGEMREFKRQTLARLSSIDHSRERAGGYRVSVAAVCIAAIACAGNIANLIVGQGGR